MMKEVQTILKEQALALLREAADSPDLPYRYFTDHDGLLIFLDGLSSEQASRRSRPDDPTSSIAAHIEHVRFAIDATIDAIVDVPSSVDWTKSWTTSKVDTESWNALMKDLEKAFERCRDTIQSAELTSEASFGLLLALLTHVAYHIGVVQEKAREISPGVP